MALTTRALIGFKIYVNELLVTTHTFANGRVVGSPVAVPGTVSFGDHLFLVGTIEEFVRHVQRDVTQNQLRNGLPAKLKVETNISTILGVFGWKFEIENIEVNLQYNNNTLTFNPRPAFDISWPSYVQFITELRRFTTLIQSYTA